MAVMGSGAELSLSSQYWTLCPYLGGCHAWGRVVFFLVVGVGTCGGFVRYSLTWICQHILRRSASQGWDQGTWCRVCQQWQCRCHRGQQWGVQSVHAQRIWPQSHPQWVLTQLVGSRDTITRGCGRLDYNRTGQGAWRVRCWRRSLLACMPFLISMWMYLLCCSGARLYVLTISCGILLYFIIIYLNRSKRVP